MAVNIICTAAAGACINLSDLAYIGFNLMTLAHSKAQKIFIVTRSFGITCKSKYSAFRYART